MVVGNSCHDGTRDGADGGLCPVRVSEICPVVLILALFLLWFLLLYTCLGLHSFLCWLQDHQAQAVAVQRQLCKLCP